MNAADDGLAGIQQLAGDATLLYYMTEEAQEGKNAYLEKRTARLRPVPEAPVTTATASGAPAPRPRTLRRSGRSPVLVGHRVRGRRRGGVDRRGAAHRRAMVVALALQVGVNYANDYSDGVRGTDADARGPGAARRDRARDAGRGASGRVPRRSASPRSPGSCSSLVVNPWLLLVGVAAIARRGTYTGGPEAVRLPRPRRGDGARVLRLRRDGRAARTCSSRRSRGLAWWPRSPSGCLSRALLVANNVRDIPTDGPCRQAHARGAPRRRAHPAALRRLVLVGVRWSRVGRASAALGRRRLPRSPSARRSRRSAGARAERPGRALVAVLGRHGPLPARASACCSLGLWLRLTCRSAPNHAPQRPPRNARGLLEVAGVARRRRTTRSVALAPMASAHAVRRWR